MMAFTKCALVIASMSFAATSNAQALQTLGSVDGRAIQWKPDRSSALAKFRADKRREPAGTADENEISTLLLNSRCDYIKGEVQTGATTAALRRFAISVYDQEIKSLQEEYSARKRSDAERRLPNLNLPLAEGLRAVYVDRRDPEDVFRTIIQPAGIAEEVWQMSLEYGKDPAYRARLARATATGSPDSLPSEGARKILERQKLDIAVDDEIARQDETFRAMLEDVRRNTQHISPLQSRSFMTPAQKSYLESKRLAWWKARHGEVNLVLHDPSLVESCKLQEIGVLGTRR